MNLILVGYNSLFPCFRWKFLPLIVDKLGLLSSINVLALIVMLIFRGLRPARHRRLLDLACEDYLWLLLMCLASTV